MGAPCIYYGTEQGFVGHGHGDQFIREPMFDLQDPERSYLNPNCTIYQEIAKTAHIKQQIGALRFGRMYFRQISGNGRDFGFLQGQPCTLAFSRILAYQEGLIAYNTSSTESCKDYVIVDDTLYQNGEMVKFLYGKEGFVTVQGHPDSSLFAQLELAPIVSTAIWSRLICISGEIALMHSIAYGLQISQALRHIPPTLQESAMTHLNTLLATQDLSLLSSLMSSKRKDTIKRVRKIMSMLFRRGFRKLVSDFGSPSDYRIE